MDDEINGRYWWVNQGTTFEKARETGFIWAPKRDKAGNPKFYWTNVSRVKAGDTIFHYSSGALRAKSEAKTNGYDAKKSIGGDEWEDDGWRVDCDYLMLEPLIAIGEIGQRLASLNMKYSPVDKSGSVNQGYLYELSEEASRLITNKISGDQPTNSDAIIEQTPSTPSLSQVADETTAIGYGFMLGKEAIDKFIHSTTDTRVSLRVTDL